MKLIHLRSGLEVKPGDKVRDHHGTWSLVTGVQRPRTPESTGRITVRPDGATYEQSYYPSVFNCEWVEREDRPNELCSDLLNDAKQVSVLRPAQFYYTSKAAGAIYVPLPREAWRPNIFAPAKCTCGDCDGEGAHDTLVIPGENDRINTTFTIHMPSLQVDNPPDWLVKGKR